LSGAIVINTQGATVLNLASAPSGLSVGMTITMWQSDEPDGNLPNTGSLRQRQDRRQQRDLLAGL
jgi:hypothetical protein